MGEVVLNLFRCLAKGVWVVENDGIERFLTFELLLISKSTFRVRWLIFVRKLHSLVCNSET